jgi:hypothetical protein
MKFRGFQPNLNYVFIVSRHIRLFSVSLSDVKKTAVFEIAGFLG